jgi:ketosteroid isomerase-like protein
MQEIILEFLFGPNNVSKGLAPLAIAGIAQGVSSLIGAFSAGKQKRDARRAAAQYEQDLARLEANRQDITNPYANMQNLSGMVTNPFQNLQVATQAAEMQATEADISLAGTLDTLRATGAGAGGATALAQAAARSKQGVAATIAQQEAQNAQLRAQGQQRMEQMQLQSEMQRQQLMGQGEYQRMSMQENRELLQLDRAQGMLDQQRLIEQQARQSQNQAIGQLVGTAASFGAQALGGTNPFTGNAIGGGGATTGAMNTASSSYSNPLQSGGSMFSTTPLTGATRAGMLTSGFTSQYGDPLSSMNFKYGN